MKLRDIIITIIVVLFFALIAMIVLFKGCEANYEERQNWDSLSNLYYSKYNIALKGVIVKKVPIDSHYCTYTIKVVKCNVKEHDVREYNEDYYLVVKGDSAKMVDGIYCGQVNDSIFIDYSKNYKITWNKKGRLEDELIVFSPMYDNFRKQGLGW